MDCLLKLLCVILMTSYLSVLLSPKSMSDAACVTTDQINGCVYTVVCLTFASSVANPECGGNPNVTFVLMNSTATTLTYGFFASTNFDSRVRTFKANHNNWEILEKQAMRYYRASITVDITQNRIKTIKNGVFLEYLSLKHLNLSNNMIEDLYDKSFLVSEISLSALEILDLSNNHINSLPNNVFSYFPQLEELYLEDNKIKILPETSFNNLQSLSRLVLRNNEISSINMTLALLTRLKYLDISHNSLLKLSGFEMIRLVSLISLRMAFNNITTIEHNTFNPVFNLHLLDLSYNNISILNEDMFANNAKLYYLDLYNNDLRTLSSKTFQHTNLHYINLEKNNITGDITNNTFKGLSDITSLNITHQSVNSIRNNAFIEMPSLNHLNLSYNLISVVENASFVNASSLKVLDLSHNKIETLDYFKLFSSNLSELYINNNNILTVPENVFENHSSLKVIDISRNVIYFVGQRSLPLNNLKFLDINYNNLSGVLVDKVFSPAKLIKYLDLSGFHLKKINDSALVNLPLVTKVNLSHNNLDFIHPNNFNTTINLLSLDVSYNNLTHLFLEVSLNNLQEIYLNNNQFKNIPDIFVNDSKLEYLDISCNKLSNVSDQIFRKINKVKVLRLAGNNLTNFNNEFTNSLNNLSELSLASNQIEAMINMSYFEHLRHLNLSNNILPNITSLQFENVHSLQILSLSGNKIKTIEPGTFKFLHTLIFLDLSSNQIKNIRFGTFRGLNNTKTIDLSKNKITNLNFIVFHECFELTSLIIDYNYILTIDVEKILKTVPKLNSLSLGGNPISCEEIIRSKSLSKSESTNIKISITSIHKVYHEDNVHGIKCGNDSNDTISSTTIKAVEASKSTETGSIYVLLAWYGIISITLIIIGILGVFFYKRHKIVNVNRESRMQFRNTSNSECYSDLLN